MSTIMTAERSFASAGPVEESAAIPNTSLVRLGFWSAIVTAIASAAWFVSLLYQMVVAPLPPWEGMQAYLQSYRWLHLINFYPWLLLALSFVVLVACIHQYAPPEKKVWSLSALAVAIVYASMASVSYNIQLSSIRKSLASGESDGLAMFVQANPHSIVAGLGNSYAYMCLAMLLAAAVFEGGRLERAIRWSLVAASLTGAFLLAWSLFDLPDAFLLRTSLP
jgi:hypothetical protein